jgi:glucose-6-phosphate 1-dehydrogenase
MKTNGHLEPTVFVIFGGAGDLTWRKLAPALFDLYQGRSMPAHFSVIAVDRVDLSEEKLRRRLHDGIKQFSRRGAVKAGQWGEFAGSSGKCVPELPGEFVPGFMKTK